GSGEQDGAPGFGGGGEIGEGRGGPRRGAGGGGIGVHTGQKAQRAGLFRRMGHILCVSGLRSAEPGCAERGLALLRLILYPLFLQGKGKDVMQRSRLRLWAGRNSGTGSGAMRRLFGRAQALSCAASCSSLLLSAGAGFDAGMSCSASASPGVLLPHLVARETGQPDPATDPRVAAFDHFLSQQVAAGEFVGIAVAIVDRGQLSLVKGYGRRSQTEGGRVDDQTVFRVASLSKAF